MTYPSNVVPYNVVRYGTPQASYDTSEKIVAYRVPRGLEYLFEGALSTLLEVNNWRESSGGLTQREAVDAFNNEVIRVSICDLIADCIRDNTEVQQVIQQVAGNGYGPTTIINNTQYSNQTIITGDGDTSGCGNDAKFGRIKALVAYIDTVMTDFFESLDAASNIITQVSELVAGIPLVETLPFDEIVNAIGNTGEFWRDSYEASVNTQLIEDFECKLWCATQASCDVTVADVRAVIEERYNIDSTQGALASLTAAALITRIATTITAGGGGTYIGDDFVYLSWLLQIAAIEATGTFFGVDPVDYATAASNGTPNNGWQQCTCQGEQTDVWDFTQSPVSGVWSPRPSQAANMVWVSGTGWTNPVNGQVQLVTSRYASINEASVVARNNAQADVADFNPGYIVIGSLPYTGGTYTLTQNELLLVISGSTAAELESVTIKYNP